MQRKILCLIPGVRVHQYAGRTLRILFIRGFYAVHVHRNSIQQQVPCAITAALASYEHSIVARPWPAAVALLLKLHWRVPRTASCVPIVSHAVQFSLVSVYPSPAQNFWNFARVCRDAGERRQKEVFRDGSPHPPPTFRSLRTCDVDNKRTTLFIQRLAGPVVAGCSARENSLSAVCVFGWARRVESFERARCTRRPVPCLFDPDGFELLSVGAVMEPGKHEGARYINA